MNGQHNGVTNAVLAAMKPGTGYTAAGVARMISTTRKAVDQVLRRMARAGLIGMRRIGGGRVYFTTQAAADAFGAEEAAALAEQMHYQRAETMAATNRRLKAAGMCRNKVVKPRPSVPAGVHIPKPAPDPIDRPVDMSNAVWTIAKTPACRFAADPASIVPGAFVGDVPAGRWSDYALQRAP